MRAFRLFSRRISKREEGFNSAQQMIWEYHTINLLNDWNEYCADLLVQSLNGGFTTFGGLTIPSSPPKTRTDITSALRIKFAGGRANWHPAWHAADQYVKFVNYLAPLNAANLVAAVGANSNPSSEIRMIRNFCAHKGDDTYQKFKSVCGPKDPVLYTQELLGPARRWEQWLHELRLIAYATLN